MKTCTSCGRPPESVCQPCRDGNPPEQQRQTEGQCVRGCTRRDRHLPYCGVPDLCTGCEPRRAQYGHLCKPCHGRLNLLLSGEPQQSLVWAHAWLGDHLGQIRSVPTDRDRVTGTTDRKTPLNLDVHDHRLLITDQLSQWVETICDLFHLDGPHQHTVTISARFLHAYQTRVEQDRDLVRELFDELDQTMQAAHQLVPWRPQIHRESLRCPECDRKAVVRESGQEHYQCRGCQSWFDGEEWETWRRLTAFHEHRDGGDAA